MGAGITAVQHCHRNLTGACNKDCIVGLTLGMIVAVSNKKPSRKVVTTNFGTKGPWKVVGGTLKRKRRGNPGRSNLFSMVAEKIPYGFLDAVRKKVIELGHQTLGVYVAHDSMGWPRYVGRGEVFSRLKNRKKKNSEELQYFSFYFIDDKKHTREIETLMIRTAGSLLSFNEKKRRIDQLTGRVDDYEPGTDFVERQSKKGRPTALDPSK